MPDYLQKVKTLSDGLVDLGSPLDDTEMVIHCLNGPPSNTSPPPTLSPSCQGFPSRSVAPCSRSRI